MSGEQLAPFAWKGIDAARELATLPVSVQEHFLLELDGAVTRPLQPRALFGHFRGIPVLFAEHGGGFIVYVLGRDADGTLVATLLHAGRIPASPPPAPGRVPWHVAVEPTVVARLRIFYS